jgi:hypothetical protein
VTAAPRITGSLGERSWLTRAASHNSDKLLNFCPTALNKEQQHDNKQDTRDNPNDLNVAHV